MREDFKNLYESISDPRKFPTERWFPMPKSGLHYEFLTWYRQFGALDFSAGETHFKVNSYPASMVRFIREAPTSGTKFSNGLVRKTITEHDPRSLVREDKVIPGCCSRPDIVAKIMKIEQGEIDKRNEKHLKEMEFLKRKRDFMNTSLPDDDDL